MARRDSRLGLLLLTAAALVAVACAQAPATYTFSPPGVPRAKTLRLGCTLPFSGPLRSAGLAAHAGLVMAIQQQAALALPGMAVELTCIDSKCESGAAKAAATKLVADGVAAIFGDLCSDSTLAVIGVTKPKRVPVISPGATSPVLSSTDFFFRTVPSDVHQGAAAAQLVKSQGGKHAAVIAESTDYSTGLVSEFVPAFQAGGGDVPVRLLVRSGRGDAKQLVAKVKASASGPGAVDSAFIAVNDLKFAAEFLKEAKAAGLKLKVVGGDWLATRSLADLLPDRSVLANLAATNLNPGSDSFRAAFAKAHPKLQYEVYAVYAFDAATALLKAAAAAGPGASGQALAAQLGRQSFAGASGPVAFDKSGDLVPHSKVYVAQTFEPSAGAFVTRSNINLRY